jgi:hypothetical protein
LTALVSVLCVSYNDLPHLERLFQSLDEQSFQDFEVIVVDNAQNASVQEFVEAKARGHRRIVYVPNANEGYTGGNVVGMKFTKGDYVMITNPDTFLERNAIEILVRDFKRQPKKVMVLVPKILIRQTDIINSIGMKKVRPSENIYTNIGYLEHDAGQFDLPEEVQAFDGSAFMFRKQLLHHTYLFDPRFFFGNETVDLAERMAKIGFVAYTCPQAIVRHHLRATVTSSKQNDRLTAIIVRNSLIHTLRNTDFPMFLRTLILGICFRNILGRIVTGQSPRTGVLYLRGLIMFLTQLGKFTGQPYAMNQ